jgi:hypothetical protein
MVTPRTSSSGVSGSAFAAARPGEAGFDRPAADKAEFDASVAPLAIKRFLPLPIFLIEPSVFSGLLSDNNLDGFHKLVYRPHPAAASLVKYPMNRILDLGMRRGDPVKPSGP